MCLAFSEFFFVTKSVPPHPNHFLKIQWEIRFWTFFCDDRNAPKKKFRIEIWTFSFEICFRNQFRTSGSGQTEITPITPIGVIGVISVWPLPEVRNWFRKQISNENVHISILNFFFGAFRSSQKNVQKRISHCIFKKWFGWGGTDFVTKKNSEKAKHTGICPSFGGNVSET